MNVVPVVDDTVALLILPYGVDNIDGNFFVELARQTLQKNLKMVRLLRFNHQKFSLSNFDAVLQSFHCPNRDTFLNKTFSLEQQLTR